MHMSVCAPTVLVTLCGHQCGRIEEQNTNINGISHPLKPPSLLCKCGVKACVCVCDVLSKMFFGILNKVLCYKTISHGDRLITNLIPKSKKDCNY